VFVAIGIQQAMRMRRVFFCGLIGCTVFLHIYLINGTILETKILNTKFVLIFSTNFFRNVYHSKKK